MDYITWQETGEEIVSIYFASDATKPLEYNFPSKDLDSIGKPIPPSPTLF